MIVVHPFVVGELALGAMRDRDLVLGSLAALPQIAIAGEDEVLLFVARWRLSGRDIGYVDAYLLAGVRLSPGTLLWTRDKRLKTTAEDHGIAAALG